MKTYGIFTAYSPSTRFEYEGLGRYLASFLKAGTKVDDVRFVVACPSWSRKGLTDLFVAFGIAETNYTFLGPERRPLILAVLDLVGRPTRRKLRRAAHLRSTLRDIGTAGLLHFRGVFGRLMGSRNIIEIAVLGAYLLVCGVIALPFVVVAAVAAATLALKAGINLLRRHVWPRIADRHKKSLAVIKAAFARIEPRWFISHVYHAMLRGEVRAMIKLANRRNDIAAWYCQTALWPQVHNLKAAQLIALPDVVFSDFPMAFATVGGHLRVSYHAISQTLSRPANFVTYSEHTKWSVAVDKFGVDPQSINVVRHGNNDLHSHIEVTGFPDTPGTTKNYKQLLLANAIENNRGSYTQSSNKIHFPFIFYASQLRRSKNALTLLRAYDYLLKSDGYSGKLILTGNPDEAPDIAQYVKKRGLSNDVIFLPGLSDPQLASAYSLADLAVNPSLSEGGMPFTFTEALSVGTPVIMGDIEVTREILTDPAIADATLFDPYDWRELAAKIKWALANREALYAQQRAFYDEHLARRTWDDVVAEHIVLLDRIAATPQPAG